jgi:hypothetical protein
MDQKHIYGTFHTKVSRRVVPNLVRETIDESNIDYVKGGVLADLSEGKLISSLSPVHDHIAGGTGIECCGNSRGKKRRGGGGAGDGRSRHDYGVN